MPRHADAMSHAAEGLARAPRLPERARIGGPRPQQHTGSRGPLCARTMRPVLYHHSGKSGWGVRPAPDRTPHSRFSPWAIHGPLSFYNALIERKVGQSCTSFCKTGYGRMRKDALRVLYPCTRARGPRP